MKQFSNDSDLQRKSLTKSTISRKTACYAKLSEEILDYAEDIEKEIIKIRFGITDNHETVVDLRKQLGLKQKKPKVSVFRSLKDSPKNDQNKINFEGTKENVDLMMD